MTPDVNVKLPNKVITDFSPPTEVTDLDIAFGARALDIMPPYDDALRAWVNTPEAEPYLEFQRTWFFKGLPDDTELYFKDGIDGKRAFRHLSAVQCSFAPKHEHKEAAVAWLLHQWSTQPPVIKEK